MIKGVIGLLFGILLLINISAECNETQIDINSASAEELDKIINVGPAIAARIIENRTYNSVDDLIKVKGIGDATLNEIKQQGLACVEDEVEDNSSVEGIESSEIKNETNKGIKETKKVESLSDNNDSSYVSTEELPSISLDSKSIKSEENTEFSGNNLAFFGVIAFCVIFGALFLVKKRKYKNEFN